MPVLNIDGQRVRIDDGFLKLSPAEQSATVDEIAKSLGGPKAVEAVSPAERPSPAGQPQERSFMQTADDFVRAAANGMTFGLADRFAAGMGAATGVGGTAGDYAGNLKREQRETERFEGEHPYIATGLDVAGGAMVPLGAIGAAARGASLGTKTLYGMGAGAGLGGLQGAFSSKDLTDIPQTARKTVEGLVVGGGVGAVIPGAAKVIGSGWNAASNAVRGNVEGMSRGASNHMLDAIVVDAPDAVHNRLSQLGPDAMLADAGPALLGKAQGASLNSDEGRSILQSALTARNDATNRRIMSDVDRALGPAEDPQTVSNAIRAHRAEVDARAYPALLDQAPPVDTSHVVGELGRMISGTPAGSMEHKALSNLRDMMMIPNQGRLVMESRAPVLHKIKGELDNVIEFDAPGLGVPAAALSRQQGALKHMRGLINESLERQVPSYAEANRASAALARRGESVELGTQYLGNGKTTASPGRFADEFNRLEPGEQIAFAKGSRGNIDRSLGTKANDLQALRGELQGEGGWNAAKLATVHGQEAADELINSVERNLAFRNTHNKVVENSQTAQRQAAAAAMKPTPASETPIFNPNMTVPGLIAASGKKAAKFAYEAVKPDATRRYGEVADILTRQGAERDRAVQSIIDALDRRKTIATGAAKAGDRGALLAAIAAHGAAQHDRKKRQGSR